MGVGLRGNWGGSDNNIGKFCLHVVFGPGGANVMGDLFVTYTVKIFHTLSEGENTCKMLENLNNENFQTRRLSNSR